MCRDPWAIIHVKMCNWHLLQKNRRFANITNVQPSRLKAFDESICFNHFPKSMKTSHIFLKRNNQNIIVQYLVWLCLSSQRLCYEALESNHIKMDMIVQMMTIYIILECNFIIFLKKSFCNIVNMSGLWYSICIKFIIMHHWNQLAPLL